jgi:hypothetical protein
LIGYLAVPLLWMALVPWGAAFLDAMDDYRRPSPPCAMWGLGAVCLGWPMVALALIISAKGARIPFTLYALCNIPGWLWCSFIAAMAVSGDWI